MTQFRTLPPFGGDQRSVAEVVRGIMDGKTNNTGLITLATSNAVESPHRAVEVCHCVLVHNLPLTNYRLGGGYLPPPAVYPTPPTYR